MYRNKMMEVALHYKSLGLSILGCNDKRPVMGSWLAYKSTIATDKELETMFEERLADQIAIICGQVSGNLEVIDVDIKNDDTGSLFDDLWNRILDYFNGQPPMFVLTATPSAGFHIVYKCEEPVKGNLKLASRIDPEDPKKRLAMIETRGEGGYFIAPPSPKYTPMMGDFDNLPVLNADVVNDLHDICRSFNKIKKVLKDKPNSKILYSFKQTPWDHYNSDPNAPALDLLYKHGWAMTKEEGNETMLRRPGAVHERHWGAVYHHESNIFYVFTASSSFEPDTGYSPTAVLAILEFDGDFSEACKALRKMGYGSTFSDTEKRAIDRAGDLFGDGMTFDEIYKMLSGEFSEINDTMQHIVEVAERKTKVKKGIFWTRGKVIKIEKSRLADFLTLQGYALLGQAKESKEKQLVHIDRDRHIIREMPLDQMKKNIQQWIYDTDFSEFLTTDQEIREALFALTKSSWTDIFDWLDVITQDKHPILRDTKRKSFIPFRNKIIVITKDKISEMDYDDLPAGTLVWENSIHARDIYLAPVKKDVDLNNSSAFLFIKRIAGVPQSLDHLSYSEISSSFPKTWQSLASFVSVIGYLLTNFKDPENPVAVILAEDTAEEGKGGGTGKGLLMQMIGHVRNVTTLFGRQWKPESDFVYQRVKLSTDIVFLDDTPRRFDFNQLYNVLTEGISVNKKYQDEVLIPYALSPKFVLSTNYDVTAEGDHGKRRQVKLFFQKYFTANHKPAKEFGKMFFSEEWTDEDWNWFFNTMFFMVQGYYNMGIVRIDNTENMKVKQIRLNYRDEFYEWMSNVIFTRKRLDYNVTIDFVPFERLYMDFIKGSGLDTKDYSKRRFHYAMKFFCEQFALEYHDQQINYGADRGSKEVKILLPEWLSRELLEKAKQEMTEAGEQTLPF